MCHTFATINEDNTPTITPVGSLVLSSTHPHGYYFDVFNRALAANLDRGPEVAVLAVDNRKFFWLKSIMVKRFNTLPAIRLTGRVSPRRVALAEDVRRCL